MLTSEETLAAMRQEMRLLLEMVMEVVLSKARFVLEEAAGQRVKGLAEVAQERAKGLDGVAEGASRSPRWLRSGPRTLPRWLRGASSCNMR
jgi:hypothetical protein